MQKKAKDMFDAFNKQSKPEEPNGWIQWKGTTVCMDIRCVCGSIGHVDAEFAYAVKCGNCGRVYFCNGHIELIEVEEADDFVETIDQRMPVDGDFRVIENKGGQNDE